MMMNTGQPRLKNSSAVPKNQLPVTSYQLSVISDQLPEELLPIGFLVTRNCCDRFQDGWYVITVHCSLLKLCHLHTSQKFL
jgi:hypothetical protein